MKSERQYVDFPLWRKKVDSSLFESAGTAIPKWIDKLWNLESQFAHVRKKKSPASIVTIEFKGKSFEGYAYYRKKGNGTSGILRFEDALCAEIKKTYLMSYMRDIERRLRGEGLKSAIETEIPFWEFLDIEYDSDTKTFKFTCHYSQQPLFPALFERLVASPKIKEIDDEVRGKGARIYGSEWKPKTELESDLGAQNVVYFLLDSKNKRLYVGKADNLVPRLKFERSNIPGWDFYRYEQLPDELGKYTVQIEEMMIRSMAYLLPSKAKCEDVLDSDCRLVNRTILLTE